VTPESLAEQLFAIDWSKVKRPVSRALLSGKARIINGVARAPSDDHKILQHMPFRPVAINGFDDVSGAAQRLQVPPSLPPGFDSASLQSALALSTAVTVGAVVLCTAYLASKLRELEDKIERLQAELQSQNLLFYAARASAYFGAVEAVREIIAHPSLVKENPDLVAQSISRLAGQRHETLAFLNHLFRLFVQLTPSHQALALDFFHATLDFFPKAVFVESQAAYKLDRFYLGDQIRQSAQIDYMNCLSEYRTWANSELKKVIEGAGGQSGRLLGERITEAKRILGSQESRLLLEHSM